MGELGLMDFLSLTEEYAKQAEAQQAKKQQAMQWYLQWQNYLLSLQKAQATATTAAESNRMEAMYKAEEARYKEAEHQLNMDKENREILADVRDMQKKAFDLARDDMKEARNRYEDASSQYLNTLDKARLLLETAAGEQGSVDLNFIKVVKDRLADRQGWGGTPEAFAQMHLDDLKGSATKEMWTATMAALTDYYKKIENDVPWEQAIEEFEMGLGLASLDPRVAQRIEENYSNLMGYAATQANRMSEEGSLMQGDFDTITQRAQRYYQAMGGGANPQVYGQQGGGVQQQQAQQAPGGRATHPIIIGYYGDGRPLIINAHEYGGTMTGGTEGDKIVPSKYASMTTMMLMDKFNESGGRRVLPKEDAFLSGHKARAAIQEMQAREQQAGVPAPSRNIPPGAPGQAQGGPPSPKGAVPTTQAIPGNGPATYEDGTSYQMVQGYHTWVDPTGAYMVLVGPDGGVWTQASGMKEPQLMGNTQSLGFDYDAVSQDPAGAWALMNRAAQESQAAGDPEVQAQAGPQFSSQQEFDATAAAVKASTEFMKAMQAGREGAMANAGAVQGQSNPIGPSQFSRMLMSEAKRLSGTPEFQGARPENIYSYMVEYMTTAPGQTGFRPVPVDYSPERIKRTMEAYDRAWASGMPDEMYQDPKYQDESQFYVGDSSWGTQKYADKTGFEQSKENFPNLGGPIPLLTRYDESYVANPFYNTQ
jgi:hypothetical protein